MRRRHALWIIPFLTFVLVLAGCESGDNGGGNVSGQVVLEGETSHAGITVELYGYGSDEPIWAVVSSHPCIGFSYSPAAHFDWRVHQPRYATTTDAAGSFVFSDVADGTYIHCARYDSFGWSSPRVVSVQGADVALGTISLFPERHFGFESLEGNTVFEEDHHYVFDGIVSVNENAELTIEPGAVLRFWDSRSLIVNGKVIARGEPEKWIVWTSDSDTIVSGYWRMVQFTSTAYPPDFSYNRIEGSHQGINSSAEGGLFDHCLFRRANAYALTLSGEGPQVTNCIFYDIGSIGLRVNSASEVDVRSSLFYGNRTYGIKAFDWDGGNIFDNWFEECGTGGDDASVHILLSSDVLFSHNQVVDCWTGMHFGSKCDSTNLIQANFFSDVHKGIYLGVTEDNRGPSYPRIHYNCFTGITGIPGVINPYCIHIGVCEHNNHDIEAESNYWDRVSETEINDCMWDNRDSDICPFVLFRPFLTSCPDSAGITC